MPKGICIIVGAGEFFDHKIELSADDIVIAADGGYNYLTRLNIKPDIIVGDFDSLGDIPYHPHIIKLPKEKDKTDMAFAIDEGLQRAYKTFRIYGGTGGRLSHTLANIQCLSYLAEHGAQGYLYGKAEITTVIKDSSIKFNRDHTGYISVFATCGTAYGVSITGLKYGLDKATLTGDNPIGVSNEFTGKDSLVSVDNGKLIIIYIE